jgi:hypothetical protein
MSKMRMTVELTSDDTKDIQRLLREWPERAAKVREQVSYLAAEYAYRQILRRVPRKPSTNAYREGLDFGAVGGLGKGEAAHAVFVDLDSSKIRKVDARKAVLYVRPKKRSRRTPPEILVLERFNPWTASSLPFAPSRKYAAVISRRARKRDVIKISEARHRDRSKWEPLLRRAGVRKIRKDHDMRIPRNIRTLPDVALEAIKMEFGLGGGEQQAHWRPGVADLRKRGMKQILLANRDLERAFTRSDFQHWNKWPKKTRRRVRLGEARKFEAFQKKLGIRS